MVPLSDDDRVPGFGVSLSYLFIFLYSIDAMFVTSASCVMVILTVHGEFHQYPYAAANRNKKGNKKVNA